MSFSVGLAPAYPVNPILQHISDCFGHYFSNSANNIVFKCLIRFWIIGITSIFNGTPQKIV